MIRIGTAGWTYQDWAGIVYPVKKERTFQPLAYLSRYFDTVEINSTFYRPPSDKMSMGWVQKVGENKNFRFTAKLWQGFTHERDKSYCEEERQFKDGLLPLVEQQMLGAILIQFPYSFKFGVKAIDHLKTILERFHEYPLIVEVRHASFERKDFFSFLKKHSIGFCNIDQPVIGASLQPSSILTSTIGYIRFHGRNYANWFAQGRNSAQRYDYLYSKEEMTQWIDTIKRMSEEAVDLFIIQNNHFRGKGACNALELKSMLSGGKVRAPETLIKAFPDRLTPITIIS